MSRCYCKYIFGRLIDCFLSVTAVANAPMCVQLKRDFPISDCRLNFGACADIYVLIWYVLYVCVCVSVCVVLCACAFCIVCVIVADFYGTSITTAIELD